MLTKRKEYINRTMMAIGQIVVLAMVLRFFVVEPGKVDGPSMEKTYVDNEVFLVDKVTYLFREPKRFEVVQAIVPVGNGTVNIIKRVVGLPGEKVMVRKAKFIVETATGEQIELDEPYLEYGTLTKVRYGAPNEFVVPDDSYFVAGDNRDHSVDSRDIGPIHRRQINGKVIQL